MCRRKPTIRIGRNGRESYGVSEIRRISNGMGWSSSSTRDGTYININISRNLSAVSLSDTIRRYNIVPDKFATEFQYDVPTS